MAVCAIWEGGSTSLVPTTSWAPPNGLLGAALTRNDGAAFAVDAATSTLTLAGTGLPNGYKIKFRFEYRSTHNNRSAIQARLAQVSGTGTFLSSETSGYTRDSSEFIAWVSGWAFLHDPSAAAQVQLQYKRDDQQPTGGTSQAFIEVEPWYYSNIGLYLSTSNTSPNGTSPTAITGLTTLFESDTAAIERSGNAVTVKGAGKRYHALGATFWEGLGNDRTQRLGGFLIDGTFDLSAFGYTYYRNGTNDEGGEHFSTVIERSGSDRTIGLAAYRGPPIGAFPNYGAGIGGNGTGSNGHHPLVVIEHNDITEVLLVRGNTQHSLATAGVDVDLNVADTTALLDAASYTVGAADAITLEKDADYSVGFNIGGGYLSTSTQRFSGRAHVTQNGAEVARSRVGDYARGDQGNTDTWAWSGNGNSLIAGTAGDTIGISAGKIAGGESGPVGVLPGLNSTWIVNLDTMNPPPANGGGITSHDADQVITNVSWSGMVGTAYVWNGAVSFTADPGTVIHPLIQPAGAAGGLDEFFSASGGGAGGATLGGVPSFSFIASGAYTGVVGLGGVNTVEGQQGEKGGDSALTGANAPGTAQGGGGGGGQQFPWEGGDGGNGGGANTRRIGNGSDPDKSENAAGTGDLNDGGEAGRNPSATFRQVGGPGAGSGAAPLDVNIDSAPDDDLEAQSRGGDGLLSDITGVPVRYGSGGNGASLATATIRPDAPDGAGRGAWRPFTGTDVFPQEPGTDGLGSGGGGECLRGGGADRTEVPMSLNRGGDGVIILFIEDSGGAPDISGTLDITLDDNGLAAYGAVEITGAAAVSLEDLTLAGTGDVLSAITATADIPLDGLSLDATAQLDIEAQALIALDDVGLAADTVVENTASAGITLDGSSVSALGAVEVSAELAIELDAASVQASGEVGIDANSSVSLADLSVDAQAVVGSAPVGAEASILLGPLTVSAGAEVEITAAASFALEDLDVAGAAELSIDAAGVIGLEDLAVSGFGATEIAAETTIGLDGLGLDATADVGLQGDASIVLGDATLASVASVDVVGVMNATLEDIDLAAETIVQDLVEGSADILLDPISLIALGTVLALDARRAELPANFASGGTVISSARGGTVGPMARGGTLGEG